MIIPKSLKKGDVVGLTAPASPTPLHNLQKAIASIEKLGLKVKVGATCYLEKNDYTSAPVQVRATELMNMFADYEIKAIICLRGGYGSAQLLPYLDYQFIQAHPKWLVGYSDITALHIAIQQNSQLATIHGTMPGSELAMADPFTIASLKQCLFAEHAITITNPKNEHMYTYFENEVKAPIIGGNLAVILSLMGTPYEIDTKGKILLLEEVSEPVYKIDRMLTQLISAGKIQHTAGIIFGTFTDCETIDDEMRLEEVIWEKIIPLQKQCILNLQAGHCIPKVSLRFGQMTYIIPDKY